MNIFISKYKTSVDEIESVNKGMFITKGELVVLEAGTPFKIYRMECYGFYLVTLDGKYVINANADVFKLGFNESEFLPELNAKELNNG